MTDEQLPPRGVEVLVWSGAGTRGFGIALLNEDDEWEWGGEGVPPPTFWMPLPPPPPAMPVPGESSMRHAVVDNRLMLDIDEEPETVAVLMQHFIDNDAADINGCSYYVTDMKNELIGGKLVSVFYLSPAG